MAHILPTNISEASPAARDASVSTLYRAQASSSVTPTGSVRAKRDQVSVACRPCRQKKAKCDALRPCTPCIKKNMNCQYETMDGETHSQATKRKYDEIARSHNVYAELFEMLATRSEQDAAKILERIRSGDQARAILNAMQPDRTNVLRPDPNRIAYENFLIGLAHSTGSLRAIINLAVSTLDPSSKMRVPDPLDFHVFRNRIVRLSYIENLIRRPQHLLNGLPAPRLIDAAPLTNPQAGASFNESHDLSGFDNLGSDDHPPHKVPAVPWTTMTASDEAVSHLVSLFLAWINPTWRFVEQDLFLHGMRSRWLRSDLCSPFLVNSICAIASRSLDLLKQLLSLDWRKRINAVDALQHSYFTTAPLPARPEDLPRYEDSHELDARRRGHEKQRALPPAPAGGTVGMGPDEWTGSGPMHGHGYGDRAPRGYGRDRPPPAGYPPRSYDDRRPPPGGEARPPPAWQQGRDRPRGPPLPANGHHLPPRPPNPEIPSRGPPPPATGGRGGSGVDTYIPNYSSAAPSDRPPRDDYPRGRRGSRENAYRDPDAALPPRDRPSYRDPDAPGAGRPPPTRGDPYRERDYRRDDRRTRSRSPDYDRDRDRDRDGRQRESDARRERLQNRERDLYRR